MTYSNRFFYSMVFLFTCVTLAFFSILAVQQANAATMGERMQERSGMNTNTHGTTTKKSRLTTSSTTRTCMQTAVDTREDALLTAFTKFSTDIIAGLNARKTGLHTAWALETVEGTPYKNTWNAWKTVQKKASADLKTANSAAWKAFATTSKETCKVTLPKDEKLQKEVKGTIAL